jgi:hypothetical protein
MKQIRARTSSILGALALFAAVGGGTSLAGSDGGTVVCEQRYALCSYAPCRPIPGDDQKALCDCAVLDGVNVGNKPCDQRSSREGPHGLSALYSAFSLSEIPERPLMTCPAGSVWTQCLDALCFVDPTNSRKAVCTCDVETTQIGQTYGGNCDVATCATSFWSAATSEEVAGGISAIAGHLGIEPPPNRACPTP